MRRVGERPRRTGADSSHCCRKGGALADERRAQPVLAVMRWMLNGESLPAQRYDSTAPPVIPAQAGIQSLKMAAVVRALLPTSQNDPSGLNRAECLLEFPQLRSYDRSALVSSSFPSRPSLGGSPFLR